MSQSNPWDNSGPSVDGWAKDETPAFDTVAALALADMTAFDKLGPLTRAAMSGSRIMFSALSVTRYIRACWPAHYRPDHRPVDSVVAAMIRQAEADFLAQVADRGYVAGT